MSALADSAGRRPADGAVTGRAQLRVGSVQRSVITDCHRSLPYENSGWDVARKDCPKCRKKPMDPTEAFIELGRIKLNETDLDGLMNRIAQLAKRTIPGAEEVSVTLLRW